MTTELTVSHGKVQGIRDILVNDLKRVVGDADILLKEVTSSTAEELSAARMRIEAQLGVARTALHDARVTAAKKAGDAAAATQEYVMENPLKVAGVVAVIAGLIAALLLRRSSPR